MVEARTTSANRVPVSIAVCTYRRPCPLAELLRCLDQVEDATEWYIDQILIVDNDPALSARSVVDLERHRYVHVPEPGVSNARNAALDAAQGELLVFIDDDELPLSDWPAEVIKPILATEADLVSGPVISSLPDEAPAWLLPFFQRDEAPAGPATWLRSGNLALRLAAVRAAGIRFDPSFNETGGEDVAFSHGLRAKGLRLRWSSKGGVVERVPSDRCSPGWIVDRERTATANYVRVRRTHDRFIELLVEFAPRIALHTAASAWLRLGSLVSRRPEDRLRARVRWARARGQVDGLLGIAGRRYGIHSTRTTEVRS